MIAQRAKTKPEILEGISKEVESSKFIERNTLKINYTDGSIGIRFHSTDVVTILKNGNYILNSGGFFTPTTKDRINTHSPARIYQNKGVWYLGESSFYDGITINKDGKVISKIQKTNVDKIEKQKKEISKFLSILSKDNLPIPDAGDCWLCSLHESKTNEPWGNKDASHLHSHIKEKYMHGSLLVNAMREAGYEDKQIQLHYSMRLVDTFKRSLRKYLQKRLIPNIAVK